MQITCSTIVNRSDPHICQITLSTRNEQCIETNSTSLCHEQKGENKVELDALKDIGWIMRVKVEMISVNNNEDFMIEYADIFC